MRLDFVFGLEVLVGKALLLQELHHLLVALVQEHGGGRGYDGNGAQDSGLVGRELVLGGGLDAMWQIVGYWLGWSGSPGKGRAVGVGEVKFRGDIKPDIKRVRYLVSMRQVRRGKLAVGIANGSVFADNACVYLAKDMRVGMIASAT